MLLGLRRKFVYLCVNHIYAGTNARYWEVKRKLLNSIGHEIGENTKVVGPVRIYGKLKTGKNVWLGTNFTLHGLGQVQIGDCCDIAPDVTCLTGSHEIGDYSRRAGTGITNNISIGNGCWIGARSTIVGGAEIEDGCVVAAGACVVNSAPADTLIGGVPGKVIKELG